MAASLSERFVATLREGARELRHHPREFAGLCFLAALLMFSYGLARPSVESLYVGVYGNEGLPRVWLAVAVGVALVVMVYNRFSTHVVVTRLYFAVSLTSALILVLLLAFSERLPGSVFLLYVWKDIYIVVLVEAFWSFANLIYPTKTARWAYGLFCAAGSLGGVTGEISVGWFAARFGSRELLWVVVPLLVVIGSGVRLAVHRPIPAPKEQRGSLRDLPRSILTLWNSRYLVPLGVLILLVQIAVTLVDYQFNGVMESAFPDTDVRTAMVGKVYATISVSAFLLQLSTGALLRNIGLGRIMLGIPVLLGSAVGGFMMAPIFVTMALAKVASKAMDYSLFRAAKELLYIPLSYDEKMAGKAIVDVMGYRVAKGGASLLLLGLVAMGIEASGVSLLILALVGGWLFLVAVIVKRYQNTQSVAYDEEPEPRAMQA